MKTVFHIITSFDLGGAERVAINLAKSRKDNYSYHMVEVCKTNSIFRESIIEELKKNQIFVHKGVFKNKKLAIVLFPFIFIAIYLKHKPTIIHTHTEIPDLSIFLFSRFYSIFGIDTRFVRTIHNTRLWTNWKIIGKKVESFFIKNKSNISISQSVKQNYESVYQTTNIPIIYNGVEEQQQQIFPHLIKGKKNILFAGRLDNQKGIHELIDVVKKLKDNQLLHFHIVGSGPEKSNIEHELSSFKNVTCYDKIYRIAQYLNSFDYLFMPSNFEGLGLMSIESSLAKTPTIINACPGLEETLPHKWPLKVKDNSIRSFIEIFENLPNETIYKELCEEAYQYALENFTIEKMQNEIAKFYLKSQ